jgi:hypothetical protein
MPRFALRAGVPPHPFALVFQEQNEPMLKFPFTENIRLTLHGLWTPGNECAEFAVGEAVPSMYGV